jgi:hypothetical protein
MNLLRRLPHVSKDLLDSLVQTKQKIDLFSFQRSEIR